ncbi:hypothetical protein GE09DRAFT_249250 [Coniochaeta sp. 2T2.1]|nr:hypothetical protein GE09DRAFT_249250 [Coniochaeta sp. 2T2.1]
MAADAPTAAVLDDYLRRLLLLLLLLGAVTVVAVPAAARVVGAPLLGLAALVATRLVVVVVLVGMGLGEVVDVGVVADVGECCYTTPGQALKVSGTDKWRKGEGERQTTTPNMPAVPARPRASDVVSGARRRRVGIRSRARVWARVRRVRPPRRRVGRGIDVPRRLPSGAGVGRDDYGRPPRRCYHPRPGRLRVRPGIRVRVVPVVGATVVGVVVGVGVGVRVPVGIAVAAVVHVVATAG